MTLINGVDYYYEVCGKGSPVLLLHGGMETSEALTPLQQHLAESHTIISVDLHGHGATPLGDRVWNMEDIADDLASLVKSIGYNQVDLLGFSLGAGIAARVAIQHPESINRLILVSGFYSFDGFYPELREQQQQISGSMAQEFYNTPLGLAYLKRAPKDELARLLDSIGAMFRTKLDWSSDVRRITAPVLLVYGDSDMYTPEYMISFFKLLGGGQKDGGWQGEGVPRNHLAILPGQTHYTITANPLLAQLATNFFANNGENG